MLILEIINNGNGYFKMLHFQNECPVITINLVKRKSPILQIKPVSLLGVPKKT